MKLREVKATLKFLHLQITMLKTNWLYSHLNNKGYILYTDIICQDYFLPLK